MNNQGTNQSNFVKETKNNTSELVFQNVLDLFGSEITVPVDAIDF